MEEPVTFVSGGLRLTGVLHVPDAVDPDPGRILYQYLKQRNGQITLLTVSTLHYNIEQHNEILLMLLTIYWFGLRFGPLGIVNFKLRRTFSNVTCVLSLQRPDNLSYSKQ